MLISLAEYANRHGKHPDNIRQKALRGGFVTARKIGRNWVIDSDEPFIDERTTLGRSRERPEIEKDDE